MHLVANVGDSARHYRRPPREMLVCGSQPFSAAKHRVLWSRMLFFGLNQNRIPEDPSEFSAADVDAMCDKINAPSPIAPSSCNTTLSAGSTIAETIQQFLNSGDQESARAAIAAAIGVDPSTFFGRTVISYDVASQTLVLRENKKSSDNTGAIIGGAVGGTLGALLIVGSLYLS